MRISLMMLLIVGMFLAMPLAARAVIVETKDGKVYKGHLIERNVLRVTFWLDGKNEKMTITRNNLKNVLQIVDENRLKSLQVKNLVTYYNYASELAAQAKDPEARDMAIRLFLISAYGDPEKYGRKALVTMSKIARNDHETRTFRSMAFLLDLLADRRTLGKTRDQLDTLARDNFIKALALLRRGITEEAKKYATKTGVSDYFDVVPGLMSYQEFLKFCDDHALCDAKGCNKGRVYCRVCAGNARKRLTCANCKAKGWTVCTTCQGNPRLACAHLSALQREVMLRLELLYAEKGNAAPIDDPNAAGTSTWSRLLSPAQMRPVPVLSLLHLTEFDPREAVYQNGKWVSPK